MVIFFLQKMLFHLVYWQVQISRFSRSPPKKKLSKKFWSKLFFNYWYFFFLQKMLFHLVYWRVQISRFCPKPFKKKIVHKFLVKFCFELLINLFSPKDALSFSSLASSDLAVLSTPPPPKKKKIVKKNLVKFFFNYC